ELGAAGEVGGPVARVHVADAHEVGRTGECEHALQPVARARYVDGLVHVRQRLGLWLAHALPLERRSIMTPFKPSRPATTRRPEISSVKIPSSAFASTMRTCAPGTSPVRFQRAIRDRSSPPPTTR